MQYCTRNPAIKKPEPRDTASIIDINDNMDVIESIICKSNLKGATDPGVGDDIDDGYSVGSNWWNVTDHRLFVAESVATGAAVWRQIYSAVSCRLTGWIDAPALTFSAADAPVYTVTCNGDYTLIIPVGARIALTHSGATKYFIVVKTSYSSPNTTFTLYGGTDYTLAAGAITNPYYSIAKAPVGFPLDPAKWTVTVTDSTRRSKTTGISDSTWYNISNAARISIPPGIWRLNYMVYGSSSVSPTPAWHDTRVCLSSFPNKCSDNLSLQEHLVLTDVDNNILAVAAFTVVTTAKTTYYVNIQCGASTAITSLRYYNDFYPMTIKAECAYL
jgi:hypothetical protein